MFHMICPQAHSDVVVLQLAKDLHEYCMSKPAAPAVGTATADSETQVVISRADSP